MKGSLLVSFLLFAVVASVPLQFDHLAPLLGQDAKEAIKDEYIVVFDAYERVDEKQVAAHMQLVGGLVGAENGSRIGRTYNIGNKFRGYHAVVSPRVRDLVRAQNEVKYVEQNQVVRLAQEPDCIDQTTPDISWGLVRTAFRENPYEDPNGPRYYPFAEKSSGEGVDAYIIDTGIEVEHPDFGGRAFWGADFIDGSEKDGNGHGTHVAGTVIGDVFGLAKSATAIAVRVLNDNGSGSFEGVVSGVNYAATEHETRKVPSVANMSLGGGLNQALLDAIQAAVEKGIMFVVAAGNNGGDSCQNSPSASEFATTVGATDDGDFLASFSNYGKCVEILAPGVNIPSAYPGGGEAILSGTSMASPHVAGVAARYMSQFVGGPLPTPQDVEDALLDMATDEIVKLPSHVTDQVNKLLFMECA